MKVRYQPYVWNGSRYTVMSVPIYETEAEAVTAVHTIMSDRSNTSILSSIRLHWKEKPIIVESKVFNL